MWVIRYWDEVCAARNVAACPEDMGGEFGKAWLARDDFVGIRNGVMILKPSPE